jgi:8-oxo-dGTP pyrophosphatase MutT (NUDIX family)
VHRRRLLALLDRYVVRFPEDAERGATIRRFVETHADCFERTCRDGHVTGSAWIVSRHGSHVLLVRHRKLGAWLQPGGHADGDVDVAAVARREGMEETGLRDLVHADGWQAAGGDRLPFDVDVHVIPARAGEPSHLHLDLRYLFVADRGAPLRVSAESEDVRWVARAELLTLSVEPSLLRMAEKAERLLAEGTLDAQ